MAVGRGAAQVPRHPWRWLDAALPLLLGLVFGAGVLGPYRWPLGLAAAGGLAELPFGALGVIAAAISSFSAGGSEAVFSAILTLALLPVALPGRLIPGIRQGISGPIAAAILSLALAMPAPGGPLRLLLPAICLGLGLVLWLALQAMRSPRGEQRRLGVAVLAFWVVWALQGVTPWGFPLSLAVALVLSFLAVRLRIFAAPLAALLGLLLAVTGATAPQVALGIAAGGTVGQILRRFGAFWGWVGFAGGVALAAGGLPLQLGEQVIAMLLLLLALGQGLPKRASKRLRTFFMTEPAPEPAGPSERIDQARRQIEELVRAMGSEAAATVMGEEADVARALGSVRERVCHGCVHEGTCWEQGFYRTYTGVRELMLRQEAMPATGRDMPPELRQRCPRPDQVATAVTLAGDQLRAEANLRRLLQAERSLARDVLIGVRQMLTWALANDEPADPARLSFRCGMARVAKTHEQVSGDCYLVREMQGGRLLVAISDGMGTGYPAAEQSGFALEAVEGFLAAGMDPLIALRAANAARRGDSGERFATVDLAVVDLSSSELSLLKIGSPETYLLAGEEVQVLRGEGLPLGAVADLQPTVRTLAIHPGDVLVLVSDGILEGPPGPRGQWLEALLESLPGHDPQFLAEAILDAALGRRRIARDDLTVLVTRFSGAVREPEIRAWVRREPVATGPGIGRRRPGHDDRGRRGRPWARRSTDR